MKLAKGIAKNQGGGPCLMTNNRPPPPDVFRRGRAAFYLVDRRDRLSWRYPSFSASLAVRQRYVMASTGYSPTAVSPVSMRDAAPSSTAL